MENRPEKKGEKERSHDLLQTIFHAQQEDAFIRDLRAHRINHKYRVLEQRLHRTSKPNLSRPHPSIKHRPLRDTQLLVKHQNKVEANIQLHCADRNNTNCPQPQNYKETLPPCASLHADAYFTPKTRKQIEGRLRGEPQPVKFQHKNYNKQSNFSIKLAEPTPATGTPHTRINRRESQCIPVPAAWGKENELRKTNFELESPFQSKCNSFSTFSHCPSRIYAREKQELVCVDGETETRGSQISGFTRHELLGYYKSLLCFSARSEGRYLAGFETMLSLMNITINETTIRQLLAPFLASPSFPAFLEAFERIVESSLRESVVDYFEIVLDGKWSRELGFEELLQLLEERMSKYHAREIVEEVYFQLDRENDHRVSVQDIVGLCYQSEDFCAFMRGYCQETQRRRGSLLPRKLPS